MFYGWYIVAAAILLSTYSGGVIGYGFTAFMAPIAATFGWSHAQISLATSVRAMEMGALDPLAGMAADRWSARKLVLIGVTIYGLGILCISQANNLVLFYAGFLIIGLGSTLSISMVPQATIARWFSRDLGKASGLRALGMGMGGVLLPVLVLIIDTYGWQTTLVILAALMWILGIPLSFVFRTRPEDYGLVPDGKPNNAAKVSGVSQSYDLGTGAKAALKMRAFWHIGVTLMLQGGTRMAVMTHVMPYLASLEVERQTASVITMFILLVSLPARLGFGWLADIFTKKSVFVASQLLTSVGLLCFWLIDGRSFGLIVVFVVTFGLGISAVAPLQLPMVREHFGTKNIGTILGLTAIFNLVGQLVSAPIAGWVFDTLGTYKPVWLVMSGAAILGAASIATTPPSSAKPHSMLNQLH